MTNTTDRNREDAPLGKKLDELEFDPHVNLAYYKDRTREWVSVSGTAAVTQDRKGIHELYQKDWKAWFGDPQAARAERRGGGPGPVSRERPGPYHDDRVPPRNCNSLLTLPFGNGEPACMVKT